MTQTWDEFLATQERFLQEVKGEGKAFGIAVSTVHSNVVKRIFTDGTASDGNPIGEYQDDKAMYINTLKNAPVKVKPRGKPGSERNIKDRKTTYFSSYKAFRSEQGREDSFVNLRLTGVLQSDYSSGLVQVNAQLWQAILKNNANLDKARGNEAHFKKPIFDIMQKEQTRLAEVFDFEIQKQLNAANA